MQINAIFPYGNHRLFDRSLGAIIVASSDECQTMLCKMNGKILKSQDY